MTIQLTINDKQLAMICDALLATSKSYTHSGINYLEKTAPKYRDLARQLDSDHSSQVWHNYLRSEVTEEK